jgi:hypothetical protein
MSWLKRNLYFVIFGVVAVALLGLSGWYLFSKYSANNDQFTKLNEAYQRLIQLNNENPNPGNAEVDNIKTAKDQRQQLTNYLQDARKYFQRISPIPDSPKVASQDFATALRKTTDQLQHEANAASIALPPEPGGYSFSFAAEKSRVTFTGGLEALAVQLGEVKTICDVLFQANVNALDNLRREKASPDDRDGPVNDYLAENSTTNDLAIHTHYEVTFRCFSSELASVLAGFGSSPYSVVVKDINVDLASAAPLTTLDPLNPPTGFNVAGAAPGAPGMAGYNPPGATPPPAALPPGQPGAVTPRGGGPLPTVLDEKQLRITLGLVIVKLLPPR